MKGLEDLITAITQLDTVVNLWRPDYNMVSIWRPSNCYTTREWFSYINATRQTGLFEGDLTGIDVSALKRNHESSCSMAQQCHPVHHWFKIFQHTDFVMDRKRYAYEAFDHIFAFLCSILAASDQSTIQKAIEDINRKTKFRIWMYGL